MLIVLASPTWAAQVWVYACEGTRSERTGGLGAYEFGGCAPDSAGSWVLLDVPESPSIDLTLNDLGVLFGSSLLVWVVAWGFRVLEDYMRSR
ncbi:hypothetical protein [Sinimarinibacterium flocculans]|uniref:Uncharacterized protein n=1 Tax=Sinimarinibacterium flocculans TaxID=985250 RepID=A0A318E0W4_9GAMM|nr:hypothetical protein [Sinimarinibacterium flocculans]PXV63059.1 hypothetical protein C8D93_1218 [Sinimarinibacterium flocculans]